jgi:hypothetical protein
MALATDHVYDVTPAQLVNPEIVNTDRVFGGSYVMLGSFDHATPADRGRVQAWNDEEGAIPFCFSIKGDTTGDTTVADPPDSNLDIFPRIIKGLTVAGLAGSVLDISRLVYATDDNTFTITPPALASPLGIIVDSVSAAAADVMFFGADTMISMSLAGQGLSTWHLGVVSGTVAGSGNLLTGIEAPHRGRILSVYGIVIDTLVGAGADLDLNLEVDGTNLTGGVIEWVLADSNGDKKAGTAVTDDGANLFHQGDLIDVEVAMNTASTAGLMGIYANVRAEPGL